MHFAWASLSCQACCVPSINVLISSVIMSFKQRKIKRKVGVENVIADDDSDNENPANESDSAPDVPVAKPQSSKRSAAARGN